MWLLYLEAHEPEQLIRIKENQPFTVKLWLYNWVFVTQCNLSFGLPRSDTCATCDMLENKIQAEEKDSDAYRQLKQQKEIHVRKGEKGYELLSSFSDRAKNGELSMITFDFQQNLPLPTVGTSDMFYSRMLWVYNFGIHNCGNGSGKMHIWAENAAKRGSSEVCSCLQDYFLTEDLQGHLVIFTDGCAGQNKNKALIAFLQRQIQNGKFDRIDHFFDKGPHLST